MEKRVNIQGPFIHLVNRSLLSSLLYYMSVTGVDIGVATASDADQKQKPTSNPGELVL